METVFLIRDYRWRLFLWFCYDWGGKRYIGRTRPVDERAERFLNQFGGHHWVIDAEKLGLGELDESVAEYFNSLLFHPISKQFISAMADVRMHPMTYRRYMWKFDY